MEIPHGYGGHRRPASAPPRQDDDLGSGIPIRRLMQTPWRVASPMVRRARLRRGIRIHTLRLRRLRELGAPPIIVASQQDTLRRHIARYNENARIVRLPGFAALRLVKAGAREVGEGEG